MNQRFIHAVSEHNLARVRLSISNELLLDPRGLTYKEMLNYASENLPELFEEDDNGEIILDRDLWGEDYLSELHVKLNKNFSQEKLQHFEEVAKVVLKDKVKDLNSQEANYSNSNPQTSTSKQRDSSQKDWKDLSCLAGGAISAIVGICVSSVPVKVTLITLGLVGLAYGAYNLHKK